MPYKDAETRRAYHRAYNLKHGVRKLTTCLECGADRPNGDGIGLRCRACLAFDVVTQTKFCYDCRLRKPTADFRKSHRSVCVDCGKLRSCRRTAQWRELHPDHSIEYYKTHVEQYRSNGAKYHAEHPDATRERAARRRARQQNAPVLERVNRLTVAERDGWVCRICFDPIDPLATHRDPTTGRVNMEYLHIDHIVPLAKGGEHSYANSQATHARCNLRKSTRIPQEF